MRTSACSGNVSTGSVTFDGTRESLIVTEKAHVAVSGLEDVVVIASEDAIYVGRLSDAQRVGPFPGAAYLWALWALFLGDAGMPGKRMSFSLVPEQGGGQDALYLEVASAVTVFLLAGRYAEAKAKRSAGSALRALLSGLPFWLRNRGNRLDVA